MPRMLVMVPQVRYLDCHKTGADNEWSGQWSAPAPLIFPSHDPASCLQITQSQITMLIVTREGLVLLQNVRERIWKTLLLGFWHINNQKISQMSFKEAVNVR